VSSNQYDAPNTSSPYYQSNVARGGLPWNAGGGGGGPGLVVLVPSSLSSKGSLYGNSNGLNLSSVTSRIIVNNATNNITLGNYSGMTMTATSGDININNSSGATVISNSADVIALTTSSNSIQLSAGTSLSLVGNGQGVSIQDNAPIGSGGIYMYSPNNAIYIESDYGGMNLFDYSPSGVGSGIQLYTPSNDINLYSGGGVFINDVAPAFNGSIVLASANNDVNIVSSNVGAGGVNLSAVGPAGNITLTTNGPVSGVVISNIYTGGSGTLFVDAANHLYWNGTFIA
jgi:uncharacterized protein (DUF2345 family)